MMYGWLRRLFQVSRNETLTQSVSLRDEEVTTLPSESESGVSCAHHKIVDARYSNWLFDRHDGMGSELHPVEIKILDELTQLEQSRQPTEYMVKRMPGVAPQLMHILRKSDFSGANLSRKIIQDAVLVQAVLRLASSAIHNPGQAIHSIEQAVLIVGQENLRQLVTSVMFRPIIDLDSGYYTRLAAHKVWDQSEQCAIACRILAQDYLVEPFNAFLSGLLQNIGLVAALSLSDRVANGEAVPVSSSFCSALLSHARILTCNIAREWDISDEVMQALEEQRELHGNHFLSPIGKTLLMGDYLSKAHMLGENNLLVERDQATLEGLQKIYKQNLG